MNERQPFPSAPRDPAQAPAADPRETPSPDPSNPTLKATAPEDKKPGQPEKEKDATQSRTWGNHPADPNRMGADWTFPPGADPEDVRDPGRQTPGAPPVDNRS